MVIEEIKLFQLLQAKIGKPEAEAFVHLIDQKVNSKFEQKKDELATKRDVTDLRLELKQEISDLRAATREDLYKVRVELKQDIVELRIATTEEISGLLRTIYLTSLSQLIAIVASVISLVLILKK